MSKYGIKIKNYQAALIYENNLGIRDMLESTNAMLTNSLFLDFLLENGLNVYKEESTRDVICLEFGFGSHSYDDEIKKHQSKINAAMKHKMPDEERNEIL